MGFKEFKSLVFVTVVLVTSAILLNTPVLPPNCYTHISFILARNWIFKDSLESYFNVECAHGLR